MPKSQKIKYIVGIDEVGRGPLAGPVTVGIVVCKGATFTQLKRNKRLPPLGKDSKKLKPEEREKYAEVLKSLAQGELLGGFLYTVIHVSNKIIDEKGLSYAIKKAMGEGLKKLKLDPKECEVRLDGGLKAPVEFTKQKTIIKGDEKEQIIAWASILAKVSRDALMAKASKKFPQYGFEVHKGYGTAKHRLQIKFLGISSFHRQSFCKRLV